MKNKSKSPRTSNSQRTQRNKKSTNSLPQRENGLTIVGIGASAGGLKALRFFFEALPATTGMAFVVITHLHPEHESVMADILQGNTEMQVSQITRKVNVEPDHVYVIPPNHQMLMADHKLDVKEFDEPRGLRSPVDHFFRSLAISTKYGRVGELSPSLTHVRRWEVPISQVSSWHRPRTPHSTTLAPHASAGVMRCRWRV